MLEQRKFCEELCVVHFCSVCSSMAVLNLSFEAHFQLPLKLLISLNEYFLQFQTESLVVVMTLIHKLNNDFNKLGEVVDTKVSLVFEYLPSVLVLVDS